MNITRNAPQVKSAHVSPVHRVRYRTGKNRQVYPNTTSLQYNRQVNALSFVLKIFRSRIFNT